MATNDLSFEITVPDDGIGSPRQALPHSRDKLGILAYYIPGFATACKDLSPDFFFIDGLAGSGLYHFKEDGTYALGSTPIALRRAQPPFRKVIAMEQNRVLASALRKRTSGFANAVARQGDCNRNLVPLVTREIPEEMRSCPILFLLDPAGFELHWDTVVECSKFRRHPRGWKAELLILVATGSVNRAPSSNVDSEDLPESNRVTAAFPPGVDWQSIVWRRKRGEIDPKETRRLLAAEYERGLRELGYRHVLTREISRPGWDVNDEGMGVYHLAFATDNDVGKRIMESAFERVHVNQPRRLQRLAEIGQSHFLDKVDSDRT